ncbi:MAG TPA: phosphoribosylaminoimidazolesuccinocarboxamide synthase [Candidatus Elarobacter sp.]|jgi:phosphoribosylaminoimidazole-succinocarboxamide synthase
MDKGHEIARGKTKALFELQGQPDMAVVVSGDAITAGDGARRDVMDGKGRIAAQTAARVFRLLNLVGLPTHYHNGGEDDDNNEMLVRRCQMIPLEVVVRGIAAGSFARRHPDVPRGAVLVPRVIEFFLKDDASHDPLITPAEIVARRIATPDEISAMSEYARLTFEILGHAWGRRDVALVDLKVEFGRLASGENKGSLVIADVIDNDSWRIWPQGREELALDKQNYRNLETVTEEALERIKDDYESVALMVGSFPQLRQGIVAMVVDGPALLEAGDAFARALGRYGVGVARQVASAGRMPEHTANLAASLDANFRRQRLVFAAVARVGSALPELLRHAGGQPSVVFEPASGAADTAAMECAKILGVDDTVVYGRVLLFDAQARTEVLAVNAQLNAPPPPPAPGTAFA